MIIDIIMIISGLILLFLGGEGLLKGSVSIAKHFGLSKILVSAVIIGFGTSMPELTVSISALLKNSPGIAVGNVIGSNIANMLLIIPIAAIIFPLNIDNKRIQRDAIVMLSASILLCGLGIIGKINFLSGMILFLSLITYICYSYISDRKLQSTISIHIQEDIEGIKQLTYGMAFIFCILGLLLLIGGSSILVDGSISLARKIGIPEEIIGLTIVAVGSSLPELATAIVASFHKHPDVVIGNIVGSNIFNILGILGISSMIKQIYIPESFVKLDIWFMLGATLFLSYILCKKNLLGRSISILMLTIYCIYIGFIYYENLH